MRIDHDSTDWSDMVHIGGTHHKVPYDRDEHENDGQDALTSALLDADERHKHDLADVHAPHHEVVHQVHHLG